jgi:4-hydroxy-tetrahydrodipicolinate synthase
VLAVEWALQCALKTNGMTNFSGSITALITPFKNGGKDIDKKTFEKLIERQIENGTNGIVPCGTTGESPTLSHKEHNYLIKLCIEIVKKRIPVIAGTGSNSTLEAIELTKKAQKYKADAALVVVPYYNKPSQEGMYLHFKAVHDATKIPIILYNVPGRTVVALSNETILKLSELPRIVGIKDATADLEKLKQLKAKVKDSFALLSGEDDLAVEFNRLGGKGIISVTSNIVPDICSNIQSLCLNGAFTQASSELEKIADLNKIMFIESNPMPVKYASFLMGLCGDDIRSPLTFPSNENKEKIKQVLKKHNLL